MMHLTPAWYNLAVPHLHFVNFPHKYKLYRYHFMCRWHTIHYGHIVYFWYYCSQETKEFTWDLILKMHYISEVFFSLLISNYINAHIMPHGGVPLGITVCLTREFLQAPIGVKGLTHA